MKTILIVEDDVTLSLMLKTWLAKRNFAVTTASCVSDAMKKLKENQSDIILSDLRLPDDSGLSLLKWVKENNPSTIIIMMTGYADINSAVESIKSGAYDYVAKPLNPEELLKKINSALAQQDNPSELVHQLKSEKLSKTQPEEVKFVKGRSAEYQRLYEYVDLVAPTKMAVLIRGASGVGKEHLARMIHDKSERASKPFVAVDCGVLSKDLSASEFFGHVKGAFTGAINNKTGYFMSANGGTLFLDEIGNLSMDIQIQLLRVLQEKKMKPVGSEKDFDIDVRIIAATNEEIDIANPNPSFRMDLYHRISEFVLYVPGLKECKEDITSFLHHFLEISNSELNKKVIGFSPEALEILVNYSWPGNIRELKNIISRMTLITSGNYINLEAIPENILNEVQK